MGELPSSISPADSVVKVPAVVKNVGNTVLTNIVAASAPATDQWRGVTLPIDTLAPGQEVPVTFELRPFYCSNNMAQGEYRLPLRENISIEFSAAESGTVSDKKTVQVPLSTTPFMVMSPPKDYSHNQTMKICYFITNPSDSLKDRYEVEFELFDRQDDIIIDYLSPLKVNDQETLLKVKDYRVTSIPRQKSYYVRGFLYENGSLFSPAYLTGEDIGIVDLSTLPQQKRGLSALISRVKEVVS